MFSLSNGGRPASPTPESAAGRNTDDGRWLKAAVAVILSHMKRHIYYQEIATTRLGCIVLTNLFRPRFLPLKFVALLLFVFALLVLPPLIIFLAHVDFSFSRHSCPFPSPSSPLLHPSCLSLSFHLHSPHPDRRSNSLSTAASKWFHPPSPLSSPANDVPRSIILWCWLPQSAGCMPVCWEERRRNNVWAV